jgi:hypothetical protein
MRAGAFVFCFKNIVAALALGKKKIATNAGKTAG